MAKVFVCSKCSYGDFDIARQETVAVSEDRNRIGLHCADLNTRRTAEELKAEVEYRITGTCPIL